MEVHSVVRLIMEEEVLARLGAAAVLSKHNQFAAQPSSAQAAPTRTAAMITFYQRLKIFNILAKT